MPQRNQKAATFVITSFMFRVLVAKASFWWMSSPESKQWIMYNLRSLFPNNVHLYTPDRLPVTAIPLFFFYVARQHILVCTQRKASHLIGPISLNDTQLEVLDYYEIRQIFFNELLYEGWFRWLLTKWLVVRKTEKVEIRCSTVSPCHWVSYTTPPYGHMLSQLKHVTERNVMYPRTWDTTPGASWTCGGPTQLYNKREICPDGILQYWVLGW